MDSFREYLYKLLLCLRLVWASLFHYNFKVSVKRIYDSGKQYAELKESSLHPSEFIIELLNGHSAYYSKEETVLL